MKYANEMEQIGIICGVLIMAYLFYEKYIASLNFWKKLGVIGPKPIPFFGNLRNVMLVKQSMNEFVKQVCDEFPNEKIIGIYARTTPVLIINDMDLIKDILIKDFSSFVDRGLKIHSKVEPLSQHLFTLEAKRWRPLRIKMAPVFTSRKLKNMFYIIQECCKSLDKYLETLTNTEEILEIREITAKFTTDVLGSCVFGLNMNAISDEDSQFRKMGRQIFSTTWFKIIKFRIRDCMPNIYNLLGPIFEERKINNFFINSIKHTMEFREKENVVRHDFVDILRELKNNPNKIGDGDIEMTDTLIASQAFVFFVAGFVTTSSTISHTLYELAQHQDIQNKLRNEIAEELEKCDGNLKFESIQNMKYLHQVFQETLRKYPVVPTLMRQSTTPYTFRGTKITIPARTKIWIPVYSLHNNFKIYPNPDKYDPDRFSEEAKQNRHQMSHLPFGNGPRNCIAERFAAYTVKSGLSKILQNYQVEICEKTKIPYEQDKAAIVYTPKHGIFLRLKKIQ